MLGPDHRAVAETLAGLAEAYKGQNKFSEAAAQYQRALAIQERVPGANHVALAEILNSLGAVYRQQDKYAEAKKVHQRALQIQEAALGAGHPSLVNALSGLAYVERAMGRDSDAVALYERLLSIQERAFGASYAPMALPLINLANIYRAQGNFEKAEQLYRRALAISEKGRDEEMIAGALHHLAINYDLQGKYGTATESYQRALAIFERVFGPDHFHVAATLNSLGAHHSAQGKYAEAAGLYKRSLQIQEKVYGPIHSNVASGLLNLSQVYEAQNDIGQAIELYKRALAIQQKVFGSDHPESAGSLNDLGVAYSKQGKHAEAAGLMQRALAIREKVLGANHQSIGTTLQNLANVYESLGKRGEAEEMYQRALAIQEKALGASHPSVAIALYSLTSSAVDARNGEKALVFARKMTAAALAHRALDTPLVGKAGSTAGGGEQINRYFRMHLWALALSKDFADERAVALGKEGFEIAQLADQSAAGAAVQQMGARLSAGSGALAGIVREHQDLSGVWQDRNKALVAALVKAESQQGRSEIDSLRRQIGGTEMRLAAIAGRLEKEFPNFTALTNPKPLIPEETQKLLGADEALVFFLTNTYESYVFALTTDRFVWKSIPIGAEGFSQRISGFRRGLDVDEFNRTMEAGGKASELFDLYKANDLYQVLLGPVERLIKDKRHLLIVPSGPLTALPFHLLVTEQPVNSAWPVKDKVGPQDLIAYRDAAWLLKRQAVTVLPSVSSLKALRVLAGKERGSKPMIGFGDPVFAPEPAASLPQVASPKVASATPQQPLGAASREQKTKVAVKTRAYTDYWVGAGVDRDKLVEALPRLEDTADELKAVAKNIGAPAGDIFLRAAATETAVKQAKLSDYRVVYFATHGLVAGDVKGLAEPSLALTLPKQASELDDGLLTASEVAQLKLNADWVVLSACNTIAGGSPGAEALSGLARSFFYAGARALLVSHWAVESDAATQLTTSTFNLLKAEPSLGRSEAMRRAMLAYMADTQNPRNAYPAFWGPFAVIGEGAVQ